MPADETALSPAALLHRQDADALQTAGADPVLPDVTWCCSVCNGIDKESDQHDTDEQLTGHQRANQPVVRNDVAEIS